MIFDPTVLGKTNHFWYIKCRCERGSVCIDRIYFLQAVWIKEMSNEKKPGCLVYIGDYTTQFYRDYNKPL